MNKFVPKSFSLEKEFKGNEKITDKKEIEKILEKVLKENKKAVEDFKKGENSALNFLIGQAMKESKGRTDTKIVKEILERRLKQ